MKLSEEEVLHVARLARLRLDRDEVARFRKELSAILDYMDMLGEIPDHGGQPYIHVHAGMNAMRNDVLAPSLEIGEVLRNAPGVHGGSFEVPRVIDED
ncbi:MAG TPA: Asp-tRNA(Asn)/Glu-tRNA(Gln) amidotransferase subunit GatC [Deltaproteobacteria bacterium]|nr:Asp-tRNA(Asn)/Glu-tRNA(Gln) amidotransferase subunit GatC [Deltaproteobacteria bacterium]HPR53680.1 Asp-tRNA(Asn)/Glu-tRNA(Gln) amidotransferase subunit GatC [Deltaproteobacteria bacterium]HXK47196.1 Asp-tRNA(Asn)/Glu-tRNA(Gln) amidotransferase subunit GatC [Deltaproteobacteria bacterium]